MEENKSVVRIAEKILNILKGEKPHLVLEALCATISYVICSETKKEYIDKVEKTALNRIKHYIKLVKNNELDNEKQ